MHADGRHPRPHRALPPCNKDENLLGSPPNRGYKKETLTVVVVVVVVVDVVCLFVLFWTTDISAW